jgi:hypothetical protein
MYGSCRKEGFGLRQQLPLLAPKVSWAVLTSLSGGRREGRAKGVDEC